MTYAHKHGPSNTELWIRPGRVDLSVWSTSTETAQLTPDEAEQLGEALIQAAKEARQ